MQIDNPEMDGNRYADLQRQTMLADDDLPEFRYPIVPRGFADIEITDAYKAAFKKYLKIAENVRSLPRELAVRYVGLYLYVCDMAQAELDEMFTEGPKKEPSPKRSLDAAFRAAQRAMEYVQKLHASLVDCAGFVPETGGFLRTGTWSPAAPHCNT